MVKRQKRVLVTPALLRGRLMIRLREWCDLTGTPLATGYKLANAGKIPGLIRVGNTIRIATAALQEQLAAAQPAGGVER